MISRSKLRGEPLEDYCKRAKTTKHEYGLEDDRIFCYGMFNCWNDDILQTCKNCKAYVNNAEPIGEKHND